MYICENWTASTRISYSRCGGHYGVLYQGQNSRDKYGRVDYDGIRVDAGWSLRRTEGTDSTIAGCQARTFWRKAQPEIFDPGENENYYALWNCPAY